MEYLILAYLGDAVYELIVRSHLINKGIKNVNDLQTESLNFVSAKSQRKLLEKLEQETDSKKIKETLLTLPGVGPKVADCIMLFSTLKCLDVFPVDVWVRRVMNDLYIHNPVEAKVNKKEIEQLAKTKYGNLAGIAQQYLFYWRRGA